MEYARDLSDVRLLPGLVPAINRLSGVVRFDVATAREGFYEDQTKAWVEQYLPCGTRLFLTACPNPNCDSEECQTRLNKYDLALAEGAVALLDDDPGEFVKHEVSPDKASLVCFRQRWNENIPPFFPRLRWPGFVAHVRRLLPLK